MAKVIVIVTSTKPNGAPGILHHVDGAFISVDQGCVPIIMEEADAQRLKDSFDDFRDKLSTQYEDWQDVYIIPLEGCGNRYDVAVRQLAEQEIVAMRREYGLRPADQVNVSFPAFVAFTTNTDGWQEALIENIQAEMDKLARA